MRNKASVIAWKLIMFTENVLGKMLKTWYLLSASHLDPVWYQLIPKRDIWKVKSGYEFEWDL